MDRLEEDKFEKLLEKRRKLSVTNSNKTKKVSANDSQLSDVIKNFHESRQYKKSV